MAEFMEWRADRLFVENVGQHDILIEWPKRAHFGENELIFAHIGG